MHRSYIVKKLLLLFAVVQCAWTCTGQYSDSTHYYTGLIATGSYNKTDGTQTTLFTDKLNAGVRKKIVTLDFDNTWVYGEQQKALTNNDFSSLFNCDIHKLFAHAYYWGLGSYVSSFSLKINRQVQAGAGVAYNFIDHKKVKFNLSDGVVYDNSDILLNDTVRDVYSTVRNSARVMFTCDTGILKLTATALFQNSFEMRSDYVVKVDAAVTVKVMKWLSFTAAYSYNRFNRTDRENTLFTYGLTLEHYY